MGFTGSSCATLPPPPRRSPPARSPPPPPARAGQMMLCSPRRPTRFEPSYGGESLVPPYTAGTLLSEPSCLEFTILRCGEQYIGSTSTACIQTRSIAPVCYSLSHPSTGGRPEQSYDWISGRPCLERHRALAHLDAQAGPRAHVHVGGRRAGAHTRPRFQLNVSTSRRIR